MNLIIDKYFGRQGGEVVISLASAADLSPFAMAKVLTAHADVIRGQGIDKHGLVSITLRGQLGHLSYAFRSRISPAFLECPLELGTLLAMAFRGEVFKVAEEAEDPAFRALLRTGGWIS